MNLDLGFFVVVVVAFCFFDNTGVLTQGLIFARQALYCLHHAPSL
jgi:hypothetical protein